MSNTLVNKTETSPSFQLKGGLYPLTALQLLEPNLSHFELQLESKIKQAPKFFLHAPIVIDISKLKSQKDLNFDQLKEILLKKQLVPVGIKGVQPDYQIQALTAGFALLPESKESKNTEMGMQETSNRQQAQANASNKTTPSSSNEEEAADIKGSNTKVITEPVRSGQQIYARGGDLIVIAQVSHGAELLADGNIHVYGTLRGRALAGVTGDTHAHIFCQSLEAELISVAGQYNISEDIDQSFSGKAVDIYILKGRLHIEPF